MKTLLRAFVLVVAALLVACGAPEVSRYKVISYNIRILTDYDTDSLHWEVRKPATVVMIESEQPDLFALQESLLEQTRYVESECPQYVSSMSTAQRSMTAKPLRRVPL